MLLTCIDDFSPSRAVAFAVAKITGVFVAGPRTIQLEFWVDIRLGNVNKTLVASTGACRQTSTEEHVGTVPADEASDPILSIPGKGFVPFPTSPTLGHHLCRAHYPPPN